ncbi:MAG: glycosyltransferase family 39 protein, partial [Bacteroidota bacterium]
LIVVCIVGYFMAFRAFRANKISRALLFIILCGLLLRIYSSTDLYLHSWDERYHALVAKNMITHPFTPTLRENPVLPYNYQDWPGNHIWLHKQPFPLWMMASSMWLFGIHEFALRLPSLILSILGIFLTFSIARRLYDARVGLLAAFFFSIHGLIVELSGGRVATDHYDLFFLVLIELAIWFSFRFSENKKLIFNILAAVLLGFAILTKWLPALIVLPLWYIIIHYSKRFTLQETLLNFFLLILTMVLVALPWQIYISHAFPLEYQWESHLNRLHLIQVIEGREGPFYYHLDHLRIQYGELIYIPLVWFFCKLFKKRRNRARLLLVTWIILPLVFFSLVTTKMQAYTLFTAPAIFIITALFCVYLDRYLSRFKYKWMIALLVILLIGLPIRYSIERIKPFSVQERNPLWARELRQLNDKKYPEGTILFNTKYPVEAMFYTHLNAYPSLPDQTTLEILLHDGHQVLVCWDGKKDFSRLKSIGAELVVLPEQLERK